MPWIQLLLLHQNSSVNINCTDTSNFSDSDIVASDFTITGSGSSYYCNIYRVDGEGSFRTGTGGYVFTVYN